jgi:hypothetical protein
MKELKETNLEKIRGILFTELNQLSEEAFLYGSWVFCPSKANDIDVLLVAEKTQHQQIYKIVTGVQSEFSYFLHVTLVCPSVFKSNPMFKEIAMKGIRLWSNKTLHEIGVHARRSVSFGLAVNWLDNHIMMAYDMWYDYEGKENDNFISI